MARGINKVIIIGNLGADPEVRYSQSGQAIANITVATSESWTDKQTNERKEQTEWHRVVIYQRLAEIAGEYLRKGSKVYIEGRLRTRKWQDQQGVERYTTEIVAGELQMLDGKPDSAQAQPAAAPVAGGNYQAPQQPQYQQQAPQGGRPFPNSAANRQAQGFNTQMPPAMQPPPFEDDIPFAPIGLECRRILHCI